MSNNIIFLHKSMKSLHTMCLGNLLSKILYIFVVDSALDEMNKQRMGHERFGFQQRNVQNWTWVFLLVS